MKFQYIIIVVLLISLLTQPFIPSYPTTPTNIHCDTTTQKPYEYHIINWNIQNNTVIKSSQNTYPIIQDNNQPDENIRRSSDTQQNGVMNSPWPMQSHDTHHTGRSNLSTLDNHGAEIWRFLPENRGQTYGSPLVDNNGLLYFTTTQVGELYSLNPNGTKKWVFRTTGAGDIWSTPAIAENGTIYLGATDTHFYAITPNGTQQWMFDVDNYIESSPAIGPEGTIYFGSDDHKIYAVHPDGTKKWEYTTGGYVASSPAIGQNGTIYIGSGDYHLYALNINGTLHWKYKTGGRIQGAPSIAPEGTIYVPSFDGYLYALNPNGTLQWKASTGTSIAAAGVALATDGTIYVGTEQLRAYHPNGTLKWITDVHGSIYGTVPAVSADGTIYVSAGGSLVAVNSDGTERWRKELTIAQIHSSPSIGPDNRVYVGSETYELIPQGYLHAFGVGPLQADAGGPYSGLASHTPIQTNGLAFGGTPPYTYLWDFGDGNTSNEEQPSHLYRYIGNYTITFTVTDHKGNHSTNTTTAVITYGPPTVTITRPESAIYLGDFKLCQFNFPLILGKITIEVQATHPFLPIDHVDFYKWDHLQIVDTEPPYTWTWDERIPLRGTHDIGITVFAYTSKTYGYDFTTITKFF